MDTYNYFTSYKLIRKVTKKAFDIAQAGCFQAVCPSKQWKQMFYFTEISRQAAHLIKFHNIVTSQTPQMLHLYFICEIYNTK